MAIICPKCGSQFDGTIFEIGHGVRCDCGAEIGILQRFSPSAPAADAHNPNRSPSFQFSLATLLIFVTGVFIAFSFLRWHSTYGLMAAILIVGGSWSFAAMRAGHHRLAYTLATPALGVIGHLALIVPMIIVMHGQVWEIWFNTYAVLLMSASTILAATILRRRILTPGPKASIGIAVASLYLTAGIFPLVWGGAMICCGMAAGLLVGGVGLILSVVFATLTLPLTLPLSMFCCFVLRKLDPWREQVAKSSPVHLSESGMGPPCGP